jgi:thiamine biosynthesis lipoprotein ApbE
VTVSVRADDCARADAWGAALNVLGVETGLPLAERLNLAAQFVTEKPDGKLEVKESTAWKNREALASPPPSAKR